MNLKKGLLLFIILICGCHSINHSKAARELKKGMTAYKSGEHNTAIKSLLLAADLDKDFVEPVYYLGQIYHQRRKDPDKGAKYYEEANRRDPQNPQILYAYGSALNDGKKFSDGATQLEEAVKLKPDFARAWFRLGNARLSLHNYSGAIDAYTKSIQADPQMMMSRDDKGGLAYHALANLYQDFDLNDKAYEVYEDGLKANPDSIRLMVGLGSAALASGSFEKADSALAKALEKEPGNAFALFNRGVALMKLEHNEEASKLFESFVRSGGGSPEQVLAAKTFVRNLQRAEAEKK